MKPLGPNDPTRIGRYRITHLLGIGGMGKVYLALTSSGRKVAVKVIHAEQVRQAEHRARFTREVTAIRRVGGFHTAQVVDADTNADEPWIASAYIPGPSLDQAVTTHGPLSQDSLRVLSAGLAEGLKAIHEHDLVHRDLKPANIILADDGPRIIDFGIALPTEGTRITRTGLLVGTPAYMAPEQTEGELAEPAVDVFSLGTVLHFAATGINPFEAPTFVAIVRRLISPAPAASDNVPGDLRDLITRCWNHDPAKRPTLTEMIALLGEMPSDRAWPPRPHAAMMSGKLLKERYDAFKILCDERKYSTALAGFNQILPQMRKAWGDDHKHTLFTRYHIAYCKSFTGEVETSLQESRQLLPNINRILGPDHEYTLATRARIGYSLRATGNPKAALEEFRQLLTGFTRRFGANHKNTFTIHTQIGYCLGKIEGPQSALKEFHQILTDQTHNLGPDHNLTLTTRADLAYWTYESGDTVRAVDLLSALVHDQTRVIGADHPETQDSKKDLQRWQNELSDV